MNQRTKNFLAKVLEIREEGCIRHRDITTLVALMTFIEFDKEIDVKNRRLVNLTGIDKAAISRSIKTLIEEEIIIDGERGYTLNKKIIEQE